ncbi:MAG: hypothetical protein K2L85_07430 [Paramuribaculum sp.]|nr:hypothetical protein [Paramuribaculum sp.]
MNLKNLRLPSFATALVLAVFSAAAFPVKENLSQYELDDERELREDSVVIEGWEFEDFDVKIPRFVRLKDNVIDMNGADWSALKKRLKNHDVDPFSIVHIGDSHLQADISTGYVRSQLQFDYGDAGRGLIVPLRLSRTNEPVDYYFKSPTNWSPLKFMSAHWPRKMGFAGTSLTTSSPLAEITVGSRVTDTYSTFADVTLFHDGGIEVESVVLDDGTQLNDPSTIKQTGQTKIILPRATGSATVKFRPQAGFALFGAHLSGSRPGIFYNVIGNNGATYNSYNRVPSFGRGVAAMDPDLIIVSLGTNEAFGHVDEARMIDQIDRLVNDLHQSSPQAQLLLVTPMECQRRSGRGYVVNSNVKTVRNIIVQYGKDHHIPVYDWYSKAGGDSASGKWISEGLYGKDRIHHTVRGYKVTGFMLYDALSKALK